MNKNEPMYIRITPDARSTMIFELEQRVNALEHNMQLAKAAHHEAHLCYLNLVALGAPEEMLRDRAQLQVELEESMMLVQRNIDNMRSRLAAMHPSDRSDCQPA